MDHVWYKLCLPSSYLQVAEGRKTVEKNLVMFYTDELTKQRSHRGRDWDNGCKR